MKIKILFLITIGIIIFYIWLCLVNPQAIIKEIKQVDLRYVFLSFFSFTLIFFLKTKRLHYFFNAFKEIKHKDIIKIYFTSSFVNYFVAFSSGVPLQIVLFKKNLKLSFSQSLSALFVARYLDLVVMILLIFLLPFSTFKFKSVLFPLLLLTFLAFLFFSAILIFPEKKDEILKILNIFVKYLPQKIKEKINSFLSNTFTSILLIKNKKYIFVPAIFITILSNFLEVLSVYFLILGFSIKVSLLTVLASQGLFALFSFFPSIPAQIGINEASISVVLSGAFGLSKSKVGAAAVVGHSITLLVVSLIFLISLFLWGKDFTQVLSVRDKKNAQDFTD